MKIVNTKINGVKVIEPQIYSDERGFFMETWNQREFDELVMGFKTNFVQDNHSKSINGVLRGLHFQADNPQGKLVRVTFGEVYDVVVDLRKDSSSYGEWFGIYLSSKNKKQLWVPKGFAHGFYVVSDYAEFVYKCTDYYDPTSEKSIIWNDKDLNINWPISSKPSLSLKDENGVSFSKLKL